MRKKAYFEEFNVETEEDMFGEHILVKDKETNEVVGSVYYLENPNNSGTSIFYIGFGDKLHPEQDQEKIQDIKSRYPRFGVELFKWVRKNLPEPYYAAFANQELKRALRAEPTGMQTVDIVTGEPISIDLIRRSNIRKREIKMANDYVKKLRDSYDSSDSKDYKNAMADLWESIKPGWGNEYLKKHHGPQKSTEELNEWAEKEMKKITKSSSSVNLVPSQGMRAAARRGIKYHSEGKAGDGFESATLTRAHKIAEGKELTPEHVKRMHSFFERHAGGRSEKAGKGEITPWDVAWLAWGGNAGRTWAASKVKQLENEKKSNIKNKISNIKKKLGKDCNCWEGYKRVPGTKPCAPGSCEKCDSHRKKKKK